MAVKVKPDIAENSTAQGCYVAAADGTAYGFNNNRSVERLLQLMDKGVATFRQQPPKRVAVTDAEVSTPLSRKPSEEVQTLRIFARVRPVPADCDEANKRVGRDTVWIYPSDLKEIVGKTGKFPMPKSMQMRLARFHLVDNVRGEPDHWTRDQVKLVDFTMSPKGGGAYSFQGTYAMEAGSRGLKGNLEGELKIDVTSMKLQDFKAYGEAKAWGASTYAPNPPKGVFPMVFAIVKADDEFAKATPPQAALYGDGEYRSG